MTKSASRSSTHSAIAASRSPRSPKSSRGKSPTAIRAARARSIAGAPRLSEPTPTTSIPSRIWMRSKIACRFDPVPLARTTSLNPSLTAGKLAAGGDHGDILQCELPIRIFVVAQRIAAAEAGVAVALGGRADRLVDAVHRELGEGVVVALVGDRL